MIYRFIDWLLNLDQKPASLGVDQAKCVVCRRVRRKTDMVQDGSGWFCAGKTKTSPVSPSFSATACK